MTAYRIRTAGKYRTRKNGSKVHLWLRDPRKPGQKGQARHTRFASLEDAAAACAEFQGQTDRYVYVIVNDKGSTLALYASGKPMTGRVPLIQ